MILEGPMIILAVLSLTIFHPGLVFHETWGAAAWSLRSKKSNDEPKRESSKDDISMNGLTS